MAANHKTHPRKDAPGATGAKYPTGIVIDLTGPHGNVFYLIGLANKLARELGLSAEEIAKFERDLAGAKTYHAHLALLRKWFGVVFVN